MALEEDPQFNLEGSARFTTTHWSVVLRAGATPSPDSDAALQRLCACYWYPIYAYVRRLGHDPHDAEDMTQEFFARLLRLNSLRTVGPDKGKFRSFLLACLKNSLGDARDAAQAVKRGGRVLTLSLDGLSAEERFALEPVSHATLEFEFDRRWTLLLLERSLTRLKDEYAATGKTLLFQQLKGFLENPAEDGEYDRAAVALDTTPGNVAVAVHRLRQRYRDLVRAEVASTVSSSSELGEEITYLFGRHGETKNNGAK